MNKQNIAVVTGGSGFVGSAICSHLAKLNFIDRILILDIKKPAKRLDQKIDYLEMDLSDEGLGDVLHSHLENSNAEVSTLVHCAAFYGEMEGWDCPFEKESRRAWEKVFSVNTFSLFFLIQKLMRFQPAHQRLSLVNISSYYGSKAPNPALYQDLDMTNVCSYGASKAASEQIVRWMNGMFGQKVRGNSIALGGVFRSQAPRFLERYNATVPAARMAVEDEVGALVAFLADPARSDYVAGQTIYLDGGKSVW
jgi:NAD(P)-dependent dehydrogenase (short-subunit alcohol dehydrogenase family)